jgi:ribonuclease VapC
MSDEVPCFVLDSYALLSHFQNESGEERLVELFEQAKKGECHLLLSLINLGELCYVIERRRGLSAVHLALAAIENLPVEILPADKESVLAAAHLKALYSISYADAFAGASAQTHSAVLLTGNPEFEALDDLIQVESLP